MRSKVSQDGGAINARIPFLADESKLSPVAGPAGQSRVQSDGPIAIVNVLRKAVEQATAGHIRSTPLCSYEVGSYALLRDTQSLDISIRKRDSVGNEESVSLDIRDLLLIGAVTESDVLLTGKTGCGKTSLATGFMSSLFGQDGYYSKTTLPTMNPSEFMDMDFPAILEGRKTLREAISGISSLTRPGIVLNEVNRAPAVIQSLLIALLDRHLEVQGVPVPMGRQWLGGQYQFRILTINEGEIYQVQELDPAIRDRMIIEIPVDAFPQSRADILAMLNKPDLQPMERESDLGVSTSEPVDHFQHIRGFRGDRWTAIREILTWLYEERFLSFLSHNGGGLSAFIHQATMGRELKAEEWEKIYRYVREKDPCVFDPAVARRGCDYHELER